MASLYKVLKLPKYKSLKLRTENGFNGALRIYPGIMQAVGLVKCALHASSQ
jgi:hypothetical protein